MDEEIVELMHVRRVYDLLECITAIQKISLEEFEIELSISEAHKLALDAMKLKQKEKARKHAKREFAALKFNQDEN